MLSVKGKPSVTWELGNLSTEAHGAVFSLAVFNHDEGMVPFGETYDLKVDGDDVENVSGLPSDPLHSESFIATQFSIASTCSSVFSWQAFLATLSCTTVWMAMTQLIPTQVFAVV